MLLCSQSVVLFACDSCAIQTLQPCRLARGLGPPVVRRERDENTQVEQDVHVHGLGLECVTGYTTRKMFNSEFGWCRACSVGTWAMQCFFQLSSPSCMSQSYHMFCLFCYSGPSTHDTYAAHCTRTDKGPSVGVLPSSWEGRPSLPSLPYNVLSRK